MPNLTVNLDADLLKTAKVYSAQHGVSISQLVREHLAALTGYRAGPSAEPPADPLLDFSRGRVGRKEAMRQLGITYFELLDRLAARGLPLPALPDKETGQMARDMNRMLDQAGR